MRTSLPGLSVVYVRRRGSALALLIAVAVLLELAAGTGLAFLAGFDKVRAVAGRFDGFWLMALVGALLISFVGYYLAYQGIFRVEGGPTLPRPQMRAVVAAGFGGFLAHGGGALDQYALEAAGAEEADAKARVAALGGWNTACSRSAAAGGDHPARDRARPAAARLHAALGGPASSRNPDRLLGRRAVPRPVPRPRRLAGQGRYLPRLDTPHPGAVRPPPAWGPALWGMALFWATDALACWAGLATFGTQMNMAALFVGFATGMLFTRRTGPLAAPASWPSCCR